MHSLAAQGIPSGTNVATHLRVRRWIIALLLLLAAVQWGRACFVANVSYLDLQRYAAGLERLGSAIRAAVA